MIYILPFLVLFLFNFSTETHYLTEVIPPEHEIAQTKESLKGKTVEFIITKNTSEEELNTIKSQLKDEGVDMIIHNIKRNADNYISKIHVEFNTGSSSANYKVDDPDGIKTFYFKSSDDGGIEVGPLKSKNRVIVASNVAKAVNSSTPSQSVNGNVWVSDDEVDVKVIELDSSLTSGKYQVVTSVKKYTLNDLEDIDNWMDISKGSHHIVLRKNQLSDSTYVFKIDSTDVHFDINTNINTNAYYDPSNSTTQYVQKVIVTKPGQKLRISENGNTEYILNGSIVSADDIHQIDPDQIKKVEVIKNKEGIIQIGGSPNKEAAVIVTTKGGNQWIQKSNGKHYKVTGTAFFEDVNENKTVASINKRSTGNDLDTAKIMLEAQGVRVKFSRIKRNELGEITRIKISLKNDSGDESSGSYKTDDGIGTIYFGIKNGTLMVTTSPSK